MVGIVRDPRLVLAAVTGDDDDDHVIDTSSDESDDDPATMSEEDEEDTDEEDAEQEEEVGDDEVEERAEAGGWEFVWRSTAKPARTYHFSGLSGLQVPLNDPEDPLEIFELFVDDAILNNMVTQTNLRAAEHRAANVKPQARIHKWRDVASADLKLFMGLVIYQGVVQKPDAFVLGR